MGGTTDDGDLGVHTDTVVCGSLDPVGVQIVDPVIIVAAVIIIAVEVWIRLL
jgi:hypothetical protein